MAAQRAPTRGRVLVVDDDEGMADVLRRLLERRFEVAMTTRSTQALDWITQGNRFDVILCDLLMPELTGMDLHERLASMVPEQARRMIFLTGGAFTAAAREFLREVANPHLEKPFDFSRLALLINARIHSGAGTTH
jgi:CheY-like chemotaxis protein